MPCVAPLKLDAPTAHSFSSRKPGPLDVEVANGVVDDAGDQCVEVADTVMGQVVNDTGII